MSRNIFRCCFQSKVKANLVDCQEGQNFNSKSNGKLLLKLANRANSKSIAHPGGSNNNFSKPAEDDEASSPDSDMHSETPEGSTTGAQYKLENDEESADSDCSAISVHHFLTMDERKLVVQAWNQVPDAKELCTRIFVHIFVLEPKLLSLFGVRDAPFDQLRDDPNLQSHALRFTQFFRAVTEYVEDNNYENFKRLCLAVGERHAQLVRVNFQPDWWSVFITSTVSCIQPYCRRRTTKGIDAWHTLMTLITKLMKRGFEEKRNRPQLLNQNAHSRDPYNDILSRSFDENQLRKKFSVRLRKLSSSKLNSRKSCASMGDATTSRKISRGLSVFEDSIIQQVIGSTSPPASTISSKRSTSETTNSTNQS